MGLTGMEDEQIIETEPILNAVGNGSPSGSPPMQEINQLEVHYNDQT